MPNSEDLKLTLGPLNVPNPFGRDRELKEIEKYISSNQNLILLGPRRVGKTTLLNAIEIRKSKEYNLIRYDCQSDRDISSFFANLLVSAKHPKIFVSSKGTKSNGEFKEERRIAEEIIKENKCSPFLIENIVSSDVKKSEEENIKDSTAFLLMLGYGELSNEKGDKPVVEEYKFAIHYNIPILCMIKGTDDDKRSNDVKWIIEDIENNRRGIYRKYENLEEFKKVLKDAIIENNEKWDKEKIDNLKKERYKNIGDIFFNSIKEQKDEKFLILIDELGELRHDKMIDDFESFLSYFGAKIKEMKVKNFTFVITGSENIFTSSYQKYFGSFWFLDTDVFNEETAKSFIARVLKLDNVNKYLDKIIEVCGTLPKDLVLMCYGLKEKEVNNEEIKDTLISVIRTPEFILEQQYLYLEKEDLDFLKNISQYLPASENEIKPYVSSKIFEKVSREQFILKENNGKYMFVSKLFWWRIMYDLYREKFEKFLKNILENG
ncbi:MAG: hypothetical protein CVT89_01495 [Candidatus Altiarchaeales archaeon HGW-Altiarchaeales-2]|nr:MAG: hypothetical protein CVT89_01495 [Candidatus Altiarchaeales archaeon HGW-Altiarchaeales-2]